MKSGANLRLVTSENEGVPAPFSSYLVQYGEDKQVMPRWRQRGGQNFTKVYREEDYGPSLRRRTVDAVYALLSP